MTVSADAEPKAGDDEDGAEIHPNALGLLKIYTHFQSFCYLMQETLRRILAISLSITFATGFCALLAVPVTPAQAQVVTLSTLLSQSSILAGGSVTDKATLSGVGESAGGAITFYYSTTDVCPPTTAAPIVVGSPFTVSGPGTYGPSASVTFSSPGTYYWFAVYDPTSGPVVTSACEPLTVTQTVSTPEFGAPAMMVAALGLLGVALLGRKLRILPRIRAYKVSRV